eukprot:406621-Lingulodinium_polyedra.AAC.1
MPWATPLVVPDKHLAPTAPRRALHRARSKCSIFPGQPLPRGQGNPRPRPQSPSSPRSAAGRRSPR